MFKCIQKAVAVLILSVITFTLCNCTKERNNPPQGIFMSEKNFKGLESYKGDAYNIWFVEFKGDVCHFSRIAKFPSKTYPREDKGTDRCFRDGNRIFFTENPEGNPMFTIIDENTLQAFQNNLIYHQVESYPEE